MSSTFHITQLELQKKKEELKTAISARDLLEDLIVSLIDEITRRGQTVVKLRIRVQELTNQGRIMLSLAKGSEGRKIEYAAFSSKEHFFISAMGTNISGVKASVLTLEGNISTLKKRQLSLLDSSSKIDAVTITFEQLITTIVKLASEESLLRKIGEQIRKTQKRINALDNILIEEIKKEIYVINEALEDQDREEIARLQVFMKKWRS
ncbi:MAG: V-type ATP synthase subunit D [Candidatus Thorarchaeota archaeon]